MTEPKLTESQLTESQLTESGPELARLLSVMSTLRRHCPWDARQTHRSLVPYLVEEAMEVVEAIEAGDEQDLREELGDLLLQVVFHSEIASERPDGFDVEDVARGISDKLVARHPHVFAPATGSPETRSADEVLADLNVTWEQRKAVEKGRSSVLEGIPDQLSAMAKATKVIGRVRTRQLPLELASEPTTADQVGAEVLDLVARAQASGIDAEQAVRDALRQLEAQVRAAEATVTPQLTQRPVQQPDR
jgi:XTP/dITP diphosphohydrolase